MDNKKIEGYLISAEISLVQAASVLLKEGVVKNIPDGVDEVIRKIRLGWDVSCCGNSMWDYIN